MGSSTPEKEESFHLSFSLLPLLPLSTLHKAIVITILITNSPLKIIFKRVSGKDTYCDAMTFFFFFPLAQDFNSSLERVQEIIKLLLKSKPKEFSLYIS